MLLSPPISCPHVSVKQQHLRLNRLPGCKARFLLPYRRLGAPRPRLGVCMAEMTRIGSGSSRREVGVSGEEDAILGGEKLPGPGREVAAGWAAQAEAALNRMSKWLVAGGFAFAVLWKHDAEIMWVLLGASVNSMLSSVLKKMFNHERPDPALRSDPGMPSSHAQSISYAAMYLALSLFYWLGTNYLAIILGAATLAIASYLSWLRVSQGLHSLNQILVGGAVGSALSALCFGLWHLLVQQAVQSSLWVRIVVILGAVVFCVSFVIYVIQHWLKDE